jgi:hypothetical protein
MQIGNFHIFSYTIILLKNSMGRRTWKCLKFTTAPKAGEIWNLFFGAWNFHDFRRAEKWSFYSEQGITEHLLRVDRFLFGFYSIFIILVLL